MSKLIKHVEIIYIEPIYASVGVIKPALPLSLTGYVFVLKFMYDSWAPVAVTQLARVAYIVRSFHLSEWWFKAFAWNNYLYIGQTIWINVQIL